MPTNKDFKRLVRARMQKTGESYTSARVRLLTRSPARAKVATPAPQLMTPPRPAAVTTNPADYAKVAGFTDATVKAKTGCPWKNWVKALDRRNAHEWSHGDLATYIHEKYKVPGWWAQNVAVGYERIKGIRERGQRRSGSYDVTKSRVYPVPLSKLYAAFSPKQRAAWLPDNGFTLGKLTANKYWRAKWPDGTPVTVNFYAKGRGNSQLQVQHEKIPKKANAQRLKTFWTERLDALEELLTLK